MTLYIVAIMFYSMAEQRERGILTAAIWVTLGTAMILWMLWLKKRNVIRVNAEGVYVRRGAHKKDIYMAWEEVEEVGISPLGPNQKAIYIARKTEAKEEMQWQGLLFSKDMIRVLYSRDLKEAIGRYYKGPILGERGNGSIEEKRRRLKQRRRFDPEKGMPGKNRVQGRAFQ